MARLLSDVTRKKLRRFRSIKRGYYAFVLFMIMVLLSLAAELWVSNRALLVKYEGRLYFPTYGAVIPGNTFDLGYQYETNYRELKHALAGQPGNWVLLPPVPWSPYEQDYSGDSYPPTAPDAGSRHYLGTDSSGRDIVARLVYGFRTAVGFAFIALTASYGIGVLLGCLMGFWGGRFDLLFQRFIEIWSQVPFLYVIMILVSLTQPNFALFVGINVLFGWMGITWYMRTLTYKEKARDYVLAARAQGAGTWRIIVHHILPNTLMMIVTLAPFTVVANISLLTALDYLGFGLAPPTPSWGELLRQGVNHLDSPWIVGSVVVAVSLVLITVSFIGEAIREAFDPKHFSRYE
ncbi:ABC-type oligopeptide transport system, permease protein [Oceanimonas sp. GK1]|uniref:ABC transporter permease n=1 Tax=Oceanimonas sp. (strain GK1 / IBRC-M 10197) TaxID=511062 RepID=UPI0002494D1B|nr:ABC transporter permease subunit [Oceanimonas sp. GK1]AEY00547.1 ABC-type oligopeptide transport system, permease protein [Oceanimonas sp. GK1]